MSKGEILMKTTKPNLVLTCLLISSVSISVHAGDAKKGNQYYQRNCARCHGVDGKPVLPTAANFQRKEGLRASEKSLLNRIKNGRRGCPSFSGTLKDEEILDLISHLRMYRR
jgi:mono/diheme cytochrome c family protein